MIEFVNVSKEFKDKKVLHDISFTINDNELVAIIGASGCGKTTTLKMINRLIVPTKGKILIDGKNIEEIDKTELRRSIGYVIQQMGLFPHMTVKENIELIQKLEKKDPKEIEENTNRLMEIMDLDGDLYLYFTVTFADGTVAEAEWFGAATAAEENTDLTPVEPVKPKITISSPDGSIVFEAELDRVEMRMEKNYKLRGGDPQYGGATFDAYFFYFVPVDTEISWQGVEGDRANVPMFMFPVANVPSEDLSLATAPEGLNWSMKYSKSGIQIPEYSNTYTMYGMTSGYCPEDAKATVVRNDDKTWNLSFSTTDFVNNNYGGSGSKNLLLIQWQGPLTKYSGTKTNDYPEADY